MSKLDDAILGVKICLADNGCSLNDDECPYYKFDSCTRILAEDVVSLLEQKNGKTEQMKAYLAGGIFFHGDYLRNKEYAEKIRKAIPNIELYSPIENTDINGTEGKKKFADSRMIAEADNKRLDEADILIACIDGDVIPAGTAAECAKFHEKIKRGDNKMLIGICTDNRQAFLTHSDEKDKGGASALGEQQYSYQNLYVTGLIKDVGVLVCSIEEAIEAIKQGIEERFKEE